MKSFLEHVAQHVLQQYGSDLSSIAVVFPNKRASLFFNEHLVRLAGRPIWSPAYTTISELFRQHSSLQVADPIKLICDLHRCFVSVTGISETLDHFYGWGQLLLSDFDDIDKNMADADKVFANLRDLHELDDISYLTTEQKEIIRKFFGNFSETQNSELKQRFLSLWSHFSDIYHQFNDCLSQQGLAYEGALYRSVATTPDLTFSHRQYLFVGFNLVQQVEQLLFSRLQQQGKARFYWDFDRYYLSDNEAGYFVSRYLDKFPNELNSRNDDIYNNFRKPKDITFVAATTENIQAHFMAQWLQQQGRIEAGKRTAVVLCDESLLPMVVHCIPDSVSHANITTGYPLNQAPVSSLLHQLYALQTVGFSRQSATFRLQYINKVLRHPYCHHLSPLNQELCQQLNTNHTYYATTGQLALDEGLALLFHTFSNLQPPQLCRWMTEVVQTIALNSRQDPQSQDDPLFAETLFQTYTLLNRLSGLMESGDLDIDLTTFHRLLSQLVKSTSIPFHGEPAVGLQIMGVLETRNLDFDHVLLLSSNEGNMPQGVNDTSFIPWGIRKAFGLTTIDHKVAIYSYYFHRLLQRAKDVTLVYNNATEDGKTGEMSRFMLQLLMESGHPIRQLTLRTGHHVAERQRSTIEKTPEVMQLLYQRFSLNCAPIEKQHLPLLTPSAINRYMSCPLKFFYYYVSGMKELEENEEDTIDGRIFGNIFHLAAQTLYTQLGNVISRQPLEALLKNKIEIEQAVDQAFKKELFNLKPEAPMPELSGIQIINREVIIKYLRQLLTIDSQIAPFSIMGLELPVSCPWTVEPAGGWPAFQTNLGGTIDRLDCIVTAGGEEKIRVVDYKTGRPSLGDMADLQAILDSSQIENHSDYYLQTFLYAMIVSSSSSLNARARKVTPALFFVQQSSQQDYDPTLKLNKVNIEDVRPLSHDFMSGIRQVVNEIFSPQVPFSPTQVTSRCERCPLADLCSA